MAFEIVQIPTMDNPELSRFDQNYFYLLHSNGKTVAFDPGDAQPFLRVLKERNWNLDAIWITHHHWDHTDGIADLKDATGAIVTGPVYDQHRIDLDKTISEGDELALGDINAQILFLPGHTTGHIAYYIASHNALFSSDVLFSLGCGRMFEGTPEQYWQSMEKLIALPDKTMVYAAHEYTETNAQFCEEILPKSVQSLELKDYIAWVRQQRQNNTPTVPMNLDLEKRINPFLRCGDTMLQRGLECRDIIETFKFLRQKRNEY